jgi:signal transduction histidine kinase
MENGVDDQADRAGPAACDRSEITEYARSLGLTYPPPPVACPDPFCYIRNLKIQQVKQEWESTVDALPQVVCLLDQHGRIIRVNRTVERWGLGLVDDVNGWHVHELLPPGCTGQTGDPGQLWAQVWPELSQGEPVDLEFHDAALDRYVRLELRSRSDGSAAGEGRGGGFAVAVLADITELKRAEESLRRFSDELERRVEARAAELLKANRRLTREVRERARAERKLKDSQDELRLLSAQLLAAQEIERKRIASELHDGIGQSLSAVKFSVDDALGLLGQNSAARAAIVLEALTSKIQRAIDEVRRIAMDLRPSMLDDLGLLATLAWFFREFQDTYHNLRVVKHVSLDEDDVPSPLRTTIFRIVQEAMNNAAKHARADTLVVSLKKEGDRIELMVKDNGQGFDPREFHARESRDRGSGLASMRERTEFCGGSFTVESAKGKGTRIKARWHSVACEGAADS